MPRPEQNNRCSSWKKGQLTLTDIDGSFRASSLLQVGCAHKIGDTGVVWLATEVPREAHLGWRKYWFISWEEATYVCIGESSNTIHISLLDDGTDLDVPKEQFFLDKEKVEVLLHCSPWRNADETIDQNINLIHVDETKCQSIVVDVGKMYVLEQEAWPTFLSLKVVFNGGRAAAGSNSWNLDSETFATVFFSGKYPFKTESRINTRQTGIVESSQTACKNGRKVSFYWYRNVPALSGCTVHTQEPPPEESVACVNHS